ncbi:MAG: winged helix-turn-helix domain-containing protein [Vicinamibacterales bacterium]
MPLLHFGPFTVDWRSATLSRGGGIVPLSPRLVQVLACLADARGALVTRELLLERFWPDVTVADNTLTRAIADIRKALDDDPRAPRFIQTMARRGYRFLADVTEDADAPAGPGAGPVTPTFAGLEPFVAWERGRVALESLAVAELPVAVEAFSRAVAGAPQYAPAYAGLANAHVFRFEATRVDDEPDAAALTEAIAAATRATTLDPAMGEGWAALGHALAAGGRLDEARAALRQATALEPGNWRHQYRLAVATWGEERLRAVERAEALLPGFPGTRTLAVTVHVARQAFDLAAAAAERGAAAQDAQEDHGRYPANGLRWLRGLTRVATGRLDDALADFTAEAAASGAASTVYARECLVLAREAAGFTRVALGQGDLARGDFLAAVHASQDHARAVLGLAVSGGEAARAVERVAAACARLDTAGKATERTLVAAAAEAWAGRAGDGLARLDAALGPGSPEPAGWSLPADPMFLPLRTAAGYARLAARLAARAA